jgi:hypothetical protein
MTNSNLLVISGVMDRLLRAGWIPGISFGFTGTGGDQGRSVVHYWLWLKMDIYRVSGGFWNSI